MYKLGENCILKFDGIKFLLCVPLNALDNTDYAQFKKAISEETAQLQNAEGTLMTAQAAKDLIKELP
jgi:cellobiose-specific phosphotransferase system component IIA